MFLRKSSLKVASNGTILTKYEFESIFLTAQTEEPTLNHWVNTLLYHLVI